MSGGDRGNARFIALNVFWGTLCAILILIIVWTMSAKYTQDRIQAERYAEHYSDDTIDSIKRDCTQSDIATGTKCQAEIIEATREAKHDAYNLQAQRDAAQWGFWMLVATGAGLVVSGIGLAALLVSLGQTKSAIEDNKTATVLEFRPILVPDGVVITPHPTLRGDFNGDVHAQVKWKNVGKTPAKMIVVELWTEPMQGTNIVNDISEIRHLLEALPAKSITSFIVLPGFVDHGQQALSPAALFIRFGLVRQIASRRGVRYSGTPQIVIAKATYSFVVGGIEKQMTVRNGFTFTPEVDGDGNIFDYNVLPVSCAFEMT